MAVTQQLARLPAEQLTACRRSADVLDALCSFTLIPKADHLDLNWWPVVLKRAWALTGAGSEALAVLGSGFDGDEEVNPSYRDHPDTIFDHPVTALEPPRVRQVAAALHAVTPEAVHAVVPSDADRVEAVLGTIAREVRGDLAEHLAREHATLRDFYAAAAGRGLAVVLWWD